VNKKTKVYSANKARVFVGISGGVDSSVSAYLLKEQGYEVHGIFVKTWSPDWLPCTWVAEKRDAMRVCATLDIPFHFLDAEEEYKKGVADYMIAEYRAGRTPNPDVLCNRIVKFGAMWQYAQAHGAEFLATGHYARVEDRGQSIGDRYSLCTGSDSAKDQAYFLWMIEKNELKHILFPIGHLEKSEIRNIAKRAELFTSEKKDSQGICFLGDVDMREFLSHYIEEKKGNVVNEKGDVIGEHNGVWFYTLGERHGFNIKVQGTESEAHYVVGKNIEKNELTVSTSPKSISNSSGEVKVILREVNILEKIDETKKYTAQIRYHGTLIPVSIEKEEVILEYDGVVPLGQSLVVYDDDKVVMAGIIDRIVI